METKISAFSFHDTKFLQSLKTQQQIWVFNSNGKVLFAMKARARWVQKTWEEPGNDDIVVTPRPSVHPLFDCGKGFVSMAIWAGEKKKWSWWLMCTIDCKRKPFLFGVNKNICMNIIWTADIEAPKTFFGLNCDRLTRKHNCDTFISRKFALWISLPVL